MVIADGKVADTFYNDQDLNQQKLLSAAVGGGK
jgi:hypothetical protein